MKIVVVGAGVAGLSIAWKLAAAGKDVTLFDRGAVGGGASMVAAGMIAPEAEYGDAATVDASFAKESATLWPAFAAEIETDSGLAIHFKRCGALLAATSDAGLAALKRRHPALPVLSAAEVHEREPQLADLAGALWAEGDAQVDTPLLVPALAKAAERRGVRFRPFETVHGIETAKGRFAGVRTAAGLVGAEMCVLAAGAWTSKLEGMAALPIHPVKGETVVLKPEGPLPQSLVWGNDVYLTPRAEGLLIGATSELAGFDDRPTAAAAAWLTAQAERLLPGVSSWRRVAHRASLRPAAPDLMPVLGATAMPGLYAATGQYRNGILFAPLLAEVLCRLVAGRDGIAAFAPERFSGGEILAPVAITAHMG